MSAFRSSSISASAVSQAMALCRLVQGRQRMFDPLVVPLAMLLAFLDTPFIKRRATSALFR